MIVFLTLLLTHAVDVSSVAFDQRLGTALPLTRSFIDEQGASHPLSDYFNEKPVILALVYYECPMLCTMVLNGALESMRHSDLVAGRDFSFIAISINPEEPFKIAADKKLNYLRHYNRDQASDGFHFLTGDVAAIHAVAEAIGFHYVYDAEAKQYAHPSGLVVLTPDGVISRYLYGVLYPPRDLTFSLIDASAKKIGSPVTQLLLRCYQYDPATGRYNFMVMRALRIGGLLTIATLLALIVFFTHRERHLASSRA